VSIVYETIKFLILIFIALLLSYQVFGTQGELKFLRDKPASLPASDAKVLGESVHRKPEVVEMQRRKQDSIDSKDDSAMAPGNSRTVTLEQFQEAADKLNQNSSAWDYADILMQIENATFGENELQKVNDLQSRLTARLRELVKSEVETQHRLALNAPNYDEGYSHFRDASATLAIYPMSNEKDVIKQAEELSKTHKKVETSLLTLRRLRYHHWAASQAQKALWVLRNGDKNKVEASLNYLKIIDPSQLDPSVSPLYSYAVEQLMNEFKHDQKAEVGKQLNDPDTHRRTMEEF